MFHLLLVLLLTTDICFSALEEVGVTVEAPPLLIVIVFSCLLRGLGVPETMSEQCLQVREHLSDCFK